MRLIDADALIEIFNHDLKCFKTNGKTEAEMYISVADMRKMIEGQQTAYDVEKVVAELVNKRELYRIREIESLRKGEPLNIRVNLAKQACIEDCIEIVKRGSVE